MGKKTKNILLVLLAAILIAAAVAYKMWTKPRSKVEDSKSTLITAVDLGKAYANDENKANTQYLNKAIEVTGTITEMDKNQDGGVVILLATDDPNIPVECTMRDKNVKGEQGKSVTIKGFCSGNSITGILLTDCILK